MPDQNSTLRGDLQQTVMNVLWTRQDATVHDVLEALSDRRPAYTTVLTVLQGLEKRGFVAHSSVEGSRKFRYRAVLSAHDARTELLQDLMHRLFAGSPALLIRHLLETEGFTLQELESIRKVLDRQQKAVIGANVSGEALF